MAKQEIHITLNELKEVIKESLGEYYRHLSLNEHVIGDYDLDWHGSEPDYHLSDGDTTDFDTDIIATIKTYTKNLSLWEAFNPTIIKEEDNKTIFKIKIETVLEWQYCDDFDDDIGRVSGWERPSKKYDDIEETCDIIERIGMPDEDYEIIDVELKRAKL